MTFKPMTPDEIIEVVTAFRDGKEIERMAIHNREWLTTDHPRWNFGSCRYRVKPEPREWYVYIPEEPSSGWAYTSRAKAEEMVIARDGGTASVMPRKVKPPLRSHYRPDELLIAGFRQWVNQTHPANLPPDQLREIEIAFISGVHWLNTCESYDPDQVLEECRSRLRELGMLP